MSSHQVPTNHKAVALAEELVSTLSKRLPNFTIELDHDANDLHPTLRIYDTAAGAVTTAAGCVIKVRPVEWPLARDVLGLTSTIFVPLAIQVCFEEDAADAWSWRLPLIGELVFKGSKLEVYECDAGEFPAVEDIDDKSNLKATFHGHIQYPMMADQ